MGAACNDAKAAGTGTYTLSGGAGNDVLFVATDGFDALDGGPGVDTVSFYNQYGPHDITASMSAYSVVGGGNGTIRNVENLTGSTGNDTLTGDAGNNVLTGGAGDDDTVGGRGAE